MNPMVQIQSLDQVWSLHTLYQILIGSAFITTAINVTWFVMSWLLRHMVRIANRRVMNHNFILGEGITRAEYRELAEDISGCYCLLVRHGTDEYISRMASDQERFEGRQQLKVYRILVGFERASKEAERFWRRHLRVLWPIPGKDARAVFALRLPIHKRLGTQFKCFIVGKNAGKVPSIISLLQKCEHVSDIKQSDSYHKDRVYFLLDQFFVVDTITPGVKNNYIFPE